MMKDFKEWLKEEEILQEGLLSNLWNKAKGLLAPVTQEIQKAQSNPEGYLQSLGFNVGEIEKAIQKDKEERNKSDGELDQILASLQRGAEEAAISTGTVSEAMSTGSQVIAGLGGLTLATALATSPIVTLSGAVLIGAIYAVRHLLRKRATDTPQVSPDRVVDDIVAQAHLTDKDFSSENSSRLVRLIKKARADGIKLEDELDSSSKVLVKGILNKIKASRMA